MDSSGWIVFGHGSMDYHLLLLPEQRLQFGSGSPFWGSDFLGDSPNFSLRRVE